MTSNAGSHGLILWISQACINTCADSDIAERCNCFLLENFEYYSPELIKENHLTECKSQAGMFITLERKFIFNDDILKYQLTN